MSKTKFVLCTLPERLVLPLINGQEFSGYQFTFRSSIRETIAIEDSSLKFQILWVGLNEKLTAELFGNLPELETVMTSTTGTSHIDVEALNTRGLTLLSLKNKTHELTGVTPTPELAWGLFIASHRKILVADRLKHHTLRYRNAGFTSQISSLKIGIIGFGRVGQKISNYAESFGASTYYYDPKVVFESPRTERTSLEWLVQNCDALFICASKESNNPILDRELVFRIKDKATLINTSRGSLVDEKAILEALKLGKIGGYATDVLQLEEILTHSSITEEDISLAVSQGLNLIVTPHIGGASEQALLTVNRLMLDQLLNRVT